MAKHNDLGRKGEAIAIQYLKKNQYEILETNWRFGKDEIDIIAKNDEVVVIVEVKTRTSNNLIEPEFAVIKKKQNFLIRAANAYIDKNNLDVEIRFDIISIIVYPSYNDIKHIADAFYPIA